MENELKAYFLVSRCWNNEDLAKQHNMTFGRAMRLLRHARDSAANSKRHILAKRIDRLIDEIVLKQVDTSEMTG